MAGRAVRSRISAAFEDPAKRGTAFLVAMLVNVVIVFLNLLNAFDDAPTWVWVLVYSVEVLIVVPLLVAYGAFTLRDIRRRRRDQAP